MNISVPHYHIAINHHFTRKENDSSTLTGTYIFFGFSKIIMSKYVRLSSFFKHLFFSSFNHLDFGVGIQQSAQKMEHNPQIQIPRLKLGTQGLEVIANILALISISHRVLNKQCFDIDLQLLITEVVFFVVTTNQFFMNLFGSVCIT